MSLILDTIVSVKRLTRDSDNSNKESYQPNLALQCVKCQLQPASAEDTAISGGVFGQTWIGFTTESGVLSGDHLTVSGTGKAYRVKGIQDWQLPDLSPHIEWTLVTMEEE